MHNIKIIDLIVILSVNSHPLYPSCRQTTVESLMSQLLSHTEPHSPLRHISTRPSSGVKPSTSLTSVSIQAPAEEAIIEPHIVQPITKYVLLKTYSCI